MVGAGGWGLGVWVFLVRVRVTRFVSYPAGLLVVVVRVAWWVRPLLENCIVDASIFEFSKIAIVKCTTMGL